MKNKTQLTLSTVVVKNPELLETSIDDETILLSIATSNYYGMDPVASRIWAMLQEPISVADIIVTLLDEFNVTRKECESDTLEFLEMLAAEKMLDVIRD